nr:hypothetical protein [Tanacetum cinerariifolium]
MQDDKPEPSELKEVIEVVTTAKIMTEVVTDAATTITAAPITASTITVAPSAARRRKGVVIRDPEETATPSTIVHSEPKSKDKGKVILVEEPKPLKKQAQIEQDEAYPRELEAEVNMNINWDVVIEHVKRKEKEDNAVLRYQALKRKPQTKAQARKNMMVYLKNIVGFKMDFFKDMSYDDIRPIFEKYFNSIVDFLEKSKKEIEEEASRALKRKNKSSEQKVAKKKKLDEEVEELKKHLQIVPNDEDDVYTEATPLALKRSAGFKGPTELNATVDGHNRTIIEASVRRHLKLADAKGISTLQTTEIFTQLVLMGYVTASDKLTFQKDEAITKEMHDGLGRDTTTASSLEAEQGSGNIAKTQTKEIPSGPSSPRTSSEGGPGCHFTIRDSPIQARPERVSNLPNEPPLREGNSSQSGEGSMQLLELMEICTKLSNRVTTLENELSSTKAVYHKALITLTKRVKKLETRLKLRRSRAVIHSSDEEEPSLDVEASPKQGRMIEEIDKDKDVNWLDKREEWVDKGEQAQEIDWNDPKVLRYHAVQNRAFSKAVVRKNMCTYLKNQRGYKQSYFKGMKYEDIRPIFKRKQNLDEQAEEEVDNDQEVEEMKLYMRIVPEEEIAIDVIPLVTKPLVIVEYKIVKEGKISTYHIIRAGGSTKRYTSMINLLENIDRKDLETLWKLVKNKHRDTRPEEAYEREL